MLLYINIWIRSLYKWSNFSHFHFLRLCPQDSNEIEENYEYNHRIKSKKDKSVIESWKLETTIVDSWNISH